MFFPQQHKKKNRFFLKKIIFKKTTNEVSSRSCILKLFFILKNKDKNHKNIKNIFTFICFLF